MAPRQKNYTGPLATPLQAITPEEARSDPVAWEGWVDEVIDKLPLLYQHYGIDPKADEAGQRLALALAFRHVPGFRLAKPERRGRPKTWTDERISQLLRDVQELTEQGHSVSNACRQLIKREPYSKLGIKEETLRRVYVEHMQDRASLLAHEELQEHVSEMIDRSKSDE